MPKLKYSIRSLLALITVVAVIGFLVLREARSTRGRFRQMHKASVVSMRRYWGKLYGTNGITSPPKFENGVSPLLQTYLDDFEKPLPAELQEYLTTSIPVDDYVSSWTFLSAAGIVELLVGIDGWTEHGYFPFASRDGSVAAVSIKDGRVYSSCEFHDGTADLQAESIRMFLDQERQDWVRYTDVYPQP